MSVCIQLTSSVGCIILIYALQIFPVQEVFDYQIMMLVNTHVIRLNISPLHKMFCTLRVTTICGPQIFRIY